MIDNPNLKLLIYAVSGAGKTVLAATALECPELLPILYMDAEGQTRSIKSKVYDIPSKEEFFTNPSMTQLNRWRVRNWSEIDPLMQKLYDIKMKNPDDSYRTIIWDSYTDFNELSLREAMGHKRFNLSQLKPPTQPEYGKSNYVMKELLSMMRDTPGLSVIGTCLPKDQEAVDSSIQMFKPAMSGQLAELVCSKNEFVGYLKTDNAGKRILQFAQKGKIYAKWRGEGAVLPDMDNPSIAKILKLIEDGN